MKKLLIQERDVRIMLGDISRTTLWRMRRDQGFPNPSGRRYAVRLVEEWIEHQHAAAQTKRK